jgi:hypothetical protein
VGEIILLAGGTNVGVAADDATGRKGMAAVDIDVKVKAVSATKTQNISMIVGVVFCTKMMKTTPRRLARWCRANTSVSTKERS